MTANKLVLVTAFLVGCRGGNAPDPNNPNPPVEEDMSAPPNSDLASPPAKDLGAAPPDMTTTSAHQLYVATTGSDSNPGTQMSPFKTISHAGTVAKPDTTVHVAKGTYTENVVTKVSGSATGRIRYVSDDHWGAQIVGTGTESAWQNNGDYVDIVGFDVSGSGRLGILNLGSHDLIAANHVHDLKVSGGCNGGGGGGIDNGDYTKSDDDVIGNWVHDVGVPGACNKVQGIYTSNLRGRIMNNVVYRVSGFGIHLWHAATGVKIINNTVFANGNASVGGGIVIGDGDAPGGVVLDNTVVANNLVVHNPAASIVEYCYPGQNCIGPSNKIVNNLVFGNGQPISLLVGTATGTVTADPKLVNYQADGSGDYHLTAGSPAIDAGSALDAPSTDYDGKPRPNGAGYDIGAYEY